MKTRILIVLLAVSFLACSKPEDIVFGPEPLKQISEQGDQFKKLSEEDRTLLVAYMGVSEMAKAFGGTDFKPTTGRTVGEVLADARVWKKKMEEREAEQKKRDAEAKALKEKVMAERKAIQDKISTSVVVAIVDKKVLPKNYDVGRYDELLVLKYAVENKSDKVIRQVKGRVMFKDPTGDVIGSLLVDIDEPVVPGKTLTTTTDSGWKVNPFMNGNIEKIAGREWSTMTAIFEPASIAFAGGEVIKAPDER